MCVCVCVCVAQLCPTLYDPMDCSLPGSFVHGILQARILEWVAIPFSGGSSWPRDWTWVSCIAGRFFTIWATREAQENKVKWSEVKVAQSYLTLCDPMDYTVHGILQARILEWVAVPFSRNIPNLGMKPRSPSLQMDLLGVYSWNVLYKGLQGKNK